MSHQLSPGFSLMLLEPTTCKLDSLVRDDGWREDVPWNEADGMRFLCPKCYILALSIVIGVHSVICWKPHVPQTISPKPGRWQMVGSSFADVSLVAGSSSVLINGGCNAHFFIRRGKIEDLT